MITPRYLMENTTFKTNTMEQLMVTKEFVMEAYKAACPSWKAKIERQFPLLIPHMVKEQIEDMASYKNFYDKSFGSPLSFTEGQIHVVITQPTMECLFRAWDFAKDFLSKNPQYLVTMHPSKLVFQRMNYR
jgi:hypothetical protein